MSPSVSTASPSAALGLIGAVLLGCSFSVDSLDPTGGEEPGAPILTLVEVETEVPEPGPELLNPLIAMVDVDDVGDFGAAIILGRDPEGVRLITAGHVVTAGTDLSTRPLRTRQNISVRFWFDPERPTRPSRRSWARVWTQTWPSCSCPRRTLCGNRSKSCPSISASCFGGRARPSPCSSTMACSRLGILTEFPGIRRLSTPIAC